MYNRVQSISALGEGIYLQTKHKITVLLVDDHEIVRYCLRALLTQQEDIEVIGEAADGQEALAQCLALSPDVVVMDVAMPQMGGAEAARHLQGLPRGPKIVALTAYHDPEWAKEILDAGAS